MKFSLNIFCAIIKQKGVFAMFTKDDLYVIGERIHNARKSKKMTQEELAKISGVSKSTISRIENGKFIKMEHLDKISQHLQLNPSEILGIDTISDNVDDFINLFCKIMYSNNLSLGIDGIINPTRLICASEEGNLVLYISDKLFTLFNDIAQAFSDVEGIKDKELKEQVYKERLQDAKDKYKKKIFNPAKPYFLLSEKNLADIINKAVDSQKHFENLMKSLNFEED